MRIDGNRRLAKGDIEHHIGGLAADARQCLERRAVVRHLAAMFLDQDFRQADHILRLHPVETDGADVGGQLGFAEFDHLLRRVGNLEQGTGGAVDAAIGCLGGKHDGHQERIGIHIIEFALGSGICLFEPAKHLSDLTRLEPPRRHDSVLKFG